MALEAIFSAVLEELTSAAFKKIYHEVRLVGDVEEEVEGLAKNLEYLMPVLYDAEHKQLKQKGIRVWLDELKDASYDIEDLLDEWKTPVIKSKKKVCFFFSLPCCGIKEIVLRHDFAVKIKEINKNLDGIAKRKNDYGLLDLNKVEETERVESTSLVDVSKVYGRNDEANSLVNKLLSESSIPQQGPYILSIVGIGGMGKTTLAQLAYNDAMIKEEFKHRIWVCVSDPFDKYGIAKAILKALGNYTPDLETLQSLFERIQESIVGKKFLLVLDDVWTEDSSKWESFYLCLKDNCVGSKILITTRKKIVAETVKSNDTINIEELSKELGSFMFEQIAFDGRSTEEREELKEISDKIVEKCKGLPLAIKVIGSLLRLKKTKSQWQSILNSEMWELDELERGIFSPLLLSYYDLSSMVKSCFLYCVIFPKDWELIKEELIKLWMTQGYLGLDQEKDLEVKGEDCFNALLSRSLIIQEVRQDSELGTVVSNKMHDIIHDVALFLTQNQCLAIMEDNDFGKHIINEKIRHLMFKDRNIQFSPTVSNLKKLRTVIAIDDYYFARSHWNLTFITSEGQKIPKRFFDQLTKLRALVLQTPRGQIPKETGKLIHLRMLDISKWRSIKTFPDALWKLTNLQTLLCPSIRRVPEGIGKLINLRHLTFCGGIYMDHPMPKEIGRLIRLRTLLPLSARGDNLACLENLIHLRCLHINVCDDVQDAREAERAELDERNDLLELGLGFQRRTTGRASEKFLKAMRPPPNLERFELYFYKGSTALPNWVTLSSTLKHLLFWGIQNWENLPPLGKLPNLESLKIQDMRKVNRVDNEFLGVERSGAPSPSSMFVFPKLKSLSFHYMPNWEEWDYGLVKKDEEDISIMPCLHTLQFHECPSLKVVEVDLFWKPTLENLRISDRSSKILGDRYKEWRMRRHAETSTATH